jgi:hypothetical protein
LTIYDKCLWVTAVCNSALKYDDYVTGVYDVAVEEDM